MHAAINDHRLLGTASLEVQLANELNNFLQKKLLVLLTAQRPRLYREDMLCTPCSIDTPNQRVKVLVAYLSKG